MNIEPTKAYIYQPLAISEHYVNKGNIFKVVFEDKTTTPPLTREDAEYVLSQYNKYRKLSVKSEVKRALKLNNNKD